MHELLPNCLQMKFAELTSSELLDDKSYELEGRGVVLGFGTGTCPE